MFLTPKNDVHRHKILAALREKAKEGNENVLFKSVKELANYVGLSEEDLMLAADAMKWPEEIQYETIETGKPKGVMGGPETSIAFASNKYLEQGKTRRIARIFDAVKIIGAVVAISSAIFTATIAIINSNNSLRRLETLQRRVEQLERQQNQINFPKK